MNIEYKIIKRENRMLVIDDLDIPKEEANPFQYALRILELKEKNVVAVIPSMEMDDLRELLSY